MRTYKTGSNQFKKRLTPFQYMKALGFVGFWTILFIYCFRVGMQYVVIPSAIRTFDPVAYAPTVKTAYAQSAGDSAKLIVPTPTPTKKDIIFTQKHGDVLWRIYGLESSFGKQPFLYCTRQGKVNDFGYGVLNHVCFDSFIQEVQTVNQWIDQHANLPLGQLLCLYNTGKTTGCNYKENFLNL